MKARKTKTRAKAVARPKDLAIRRNAGGRSARVKGGVCDMKTRQTRQTMMTQDL
jgi:hypothetical protein